ncbi:unnamed protein product [Bursaphelenchus okinawaensis]|uniref:mitogen-activated protein kinase kinase n=1 Tax=Bursaphelenchus okinawaensis TaxID=465554 RepID=A0A811KKS6_9BILA|nr:unnamed protein product [Bursaphelenchus okinawaensis]CAG9105271.1 unnamed protein product [Bursaphelenchus okinawaensis]
MESEPSSSGGMKQKKRMMPKLKMPEMPKAATVDLDDKFYYEENGEKVLVTALDLVVVRELGRGAYGVVEEMEHTVTKRHFAVKRIHFSSNDEEQRRMLLELDTCMKSKNCELMVKFYGAMFRENDVWICMEVMDISLDKFYKKVTDIGEKMPENIIGKVAVSLVDGLNFMKEEMGLIHRDVKPSNILIARNGTIKICDFGISGQLTNSVAKTLQAGCKPYMPPERIDGDLKQAYGVQADVWSLGITLLEIAHGQHPYAHWKTPFEQLKQVVQEAPPSLNPSRGYSSQLHDFITVCLIKDCKQRPKYKDLLQHPFIQWAREQDSDEILPFIGMIVDRIKDDESALRNSLGK